MSIKKIFALFVLLEFMISCGKDIPTIDYSKEMADLNLAYVNDSLKFSPINLCDVFNKTEWESVYIIEGLYSTDEFYDLDIENIDDVDDEIRPILYNDMRVALLFVKNDNVDAVSIIGHQPNFQFFSNDAFPIVNETNCNAVVEVRYYPEGQYVYFKENK